MKKYITHANVLGLEPGDTFFSDDEFYAKIAESGVIEEVNEDGGSTPSDPARNAGEGVEGSLGEGDDGGSTESGGTGQGALSK